MLNNAQYDYVKNILIEKMSRYRRKSFQLQRLYENILLKTEEEAYIQFDYDDFKKMFIAECVQNKNLDHNFTIVEDGYLDKKQKYPYTTINVEVLGKTRM